jgi:HEAT repeats
MAQPSKVGPVILTIFAFPFLGGGLFFIYALTVASRNFNPADLALRLVMASFFFLVGAGLLFAAFKAYGFLKKQAALQEANPLSPWLWRADWAASRAEGANKRRYISAWIAAVFVNLITAPFMFGRIPELLRQGDPRAFILLAFCSFGAILTINAIRATIRHERFGSSYFEFDSLPICPGRRMTGRIQLRFQTLAAHGIDLRLSCVRRIVSGSGNSRAVSNATLWQADKNVPSGAIEPGPLGRAIPVDFEVPADGLITDHRNADDQILWLLHAQADVPGADYSDDFELPVFRTADSPEPASDSASQANASGLGSFGFAAEKSTDADSGAVAQPTRTKVVVSMHDGGTEFFFPPLRTPARALLLFVVSAAFTGAVYALLHNRVPLLFTAMFALGDLFVLFGFLHVAFGSARIFAGNGEIQSRGGVLGFGALRRTPFAEIASILPVAGPSQGSGSDNSVYSIQLRTKSGKKFTLADEISSRLEARWIVAQLETVAGLKLDTHVEVSLPLGVRAQPAQLRTPQTGVRVQTSGSSWVPFAVFAAFLLALFAWQTNKWSGRSRSVRANSSRTATLPRPRPVAPRVFSGPLTDGDIERVLALPAQAQAEELFERAIGHDARALEVFLRQVDGWIGHINRRDSVAQLLERAQFSKDLRIRIAQMDLSLAVEGFHENEQAADSLIARASMDPQHRAWAVYYLGMLAGRDVDYDRIHKVLLDYARNDQEPNVRQWAVEGLRFLGKDEVLDELFTSFTQDPSMNVRDRAGCNISDCGVFTRKQRMRMVPKFIELAAQPNLSPQMRSWCFMALREITDENLPSDADAWNRWHADHGAERMAEFERIEWWQVRGDE